MKLLQRIKFVLKYDIEPVFYLTTHQGTQAFISYDDAKEWSDKQIQTRPPISVRVTRL